MVAKKKVHETVVREVIEKPAKKKKTAKKKPASKKRTASHKETIIREKVVYPPESKTEKALVENFISLQKVMTNLSIKFDNLSTQISKLLELFEISAKSLAEKDVENEKANRDTRAILERMDNMVEQNKTIARGLTLMHDHLEDNDIYASSSFEPPRPLPRITPPQRPHSSMPRPSSSGQVPKQVMEQGNMEYSKSISSKSPENP